MNGVSPSNNSTLQHIQQINQHLGSLVMTTPTAATEQLPKTGRSHKTQRLLSDPGIYGWEEGKIIFDLIRGGVIMY